MPVLCASELFLTAFKPHLVKTIQGNKITDSQLLGNLVSFLISQSLFK